MKRPTPSANPSGGDKRADLAPPPDPGPLADSPGNLTDAPVGNDGGDGTARGTYRNIELCYLRPAPYNPRTQFSDESLAELAASIKAHGVLEPLLVRSAMIPLSPHSSSTLLGYEIVAGERRYRAALLAGEREVPCIVRKLTDQEARLITVTENLQRKDLDPFDEARGFQVLAETGMRQAEIARQLGCAQSRISKVTGLLRLPPAVQTLIRDGKLTPSHGERLLPWAEWPDVCAAIAEAAAEAKLTAADLEKPKNWPPSVKSAVGAVKSVRQVDWRTPFDRAVCSQKCPFKAYRVTGYDAGICLRPDHFDALNAEAQTAKAAKQDALRQQAIAGRQAATRLPMAPDGQDARESGPPPGGVRAGADGTTVSAPAASGNGVSTAIPLLREMKGVVELDRTALPTGCDGETCPCRGAAANNSGQLTPVCTDGARFTSLKAVDRGRQQDARRDEVRDAELRLPDALRSPDPASLPLLALVAAEACGAVVKQIGSKATAALLDEAVARFGVRLPADFGTFAALYEKNYFFPAERRRVFEAALARLDPLDILRFTGEVIVHAEVAEYVMHGKNPHVAEPLYPRLLERLGQPPGGPEGVKEVNGTSPSSASAAGALAALDAAAADIAVVVIERVRDEEAHSEPEGAG